MYSAEYEVFKLNREEMLAKKLSQYKEIKTVPQFLDYIRTTDFPIDKLFEATAAEIRKDLSKATPLFRGLNVYVYDANDAWKAIVYYGFDFVLNDIRAQSAESAAWDLLARYIAFELQSGEEFDDVYTSEEIKGYLSRLDEEYGIFGIFKKSKFYWRIACSKTRRPGNVSAETHMYGDENLVILSDVKGKSEIMSKEKVFIHEIIHTLWRCKYGDVISGLENVEAIFENHNLPVLSMIMSNDVTAGTQAVAGRVEEVVDSIALYTVMRRSQAGSSLKLDEFLKDIYDNFKS